MTQALDDLRAATVEWHKARDARDGLRQRLHAAIEIAREAYETWAQKVRAAMDHGAPRKDVAAAAAVTVARLYQL